MMLVNADDTDAKAAGGVAIVQPAAGDDAVLAGGIDPSTLAYNAPFLPYAPGMEDLLRAEFYG